MTGVELNGGIVGPINTPTGGPTGQASGIWTLGEIYEHEHDDLWPVPFDGFIAQFEPNFPSSTAVYARAVDLDSNGDLFVAFDTYTNTYGAYYDAGFAKINTTAKTLTDTRKFLIDGSYSSANTLISNLTVDTANSDDIYISGYHSSSAVTPGAYSVKLNSSYAEQWFGINSSDEFWRRGATSQATYTNYPSSHRLSPNGSYFYHGAYGLNTGYDGMIVPAPPSTGVRSGANNLTDYANPSNMGFYLFALGMNNSNVAWLGRTYHLSYGGYHCTVLKVYNGGSTASAVGLRIDFNGGSYSGGSYMNNAHCGELYNTATNLDRYPYMGIVQGGTGSGTAYFFRWNHASGWNTFDQGYRFAVNAADSPANPTAMSQLFGITFSADDSTCYATFSDNGGTPGQQYLVSFDPHTSSTTVNWQRKILVYKTGEAMPGSQQNCSFSNLKLDSAGEFLYFAGHISSSGNAQNKMLVFKLPADGSGTGTFTAGDYTIVYGASNMTGTQGDLVGSTTGNTFTSAYPSENGTKARTQTAVTGTLTIG